MPKRIEHPEFGVVEFPDNMSDDEIVKAFQNNSNKKPTSWAQTAGNTAAGLARGAGSIGATILSPVDWLARKANDGKPINIGGIDMLGQDRRAGMDSALGMMGADTDSWAYKGGKIAAEIAGTLPVGGILGQGAKAAGMSKPVIEALATGGMRAGAAGIGARTLAGAASGAAGAALVNPEDALKGAVIGGALPRGVKLLGAAGRALRGNVSPEVAQLAQRAKQLGIQVPADRIANSKPMNALAASLNYLPFAGRQGVEEAMNVQLKRAVSRTMGQDTPNLALAVDSAKTKLGAEFDSMLKNNSVKVDSQLINDLSTVINNAGAELGEQGLSVITKQFDDIIAKAASGQIEGQAAYNIKRVLDRIGSGNTPEAFHAKQLRNAMMSALDRTVGPQKAAAFAETRKQYGNMKSVAPLVQNGADGSISAARLGNLKTARSKELQELADISAQFVKPREGQHGAAQRIYLGAGQIGSSIANPSLIPLFAGGMLAGRAANSALNSNVARKLVIGKSGNGLLGRLSNDQLSYLPGLLGALSAH